MFWQEDRSDEGYRVPDDVVDVLFSIDCRRLPVDHAYSLAEALCGAAPWLRGEPGVAVHTVHVAGSQNGWERPEHGTDRHLIVSRRTKLTLRVPSHLVEPLRRELKGKTLSVGACPLTLGESKVRSLSAEGTLFARYVVGGLGQTESEFLDWAVAELAALNIRVRKALCGKTVTLDTPDGPLHTRSLMLADLAPEESVRLQQQGLGQHRAMGCGIFIPHKGIDPVTKGR